MFEATVRDHFAAAHFLPEYNGHCKNMHGHNWKIEAVVCGEQLNAMGMLEDFYILKKRLKEVTDLMDHTCLNDLDLFQKNNPTTENVARIIFQQYQPKILPLKLKSIQVFESDSAGVVYYESN